MGELKMNNDSIQSRKVHQTIGDTEASQSKIELEVILKLNEYRLSLAILVLPNKIKGMNLSFDEYGRQSLLRFHLLNPLEVSRKDLAKKIVILCKRIDTCPILQHDRMSFMI